MKILDLSDNWPKTVALILLTAFLLWGWGCPSRVPSLLERGKNITRPELQIELDTLIATAEFRMTSLDQQDQFRDLIFQNALLLVQGGQLNPVGIVTMLLTIYGATRGASDIIKKVKKKSTT